MFREVTAAEWTAIEAADAKYVLPSPDLVARWRAAGCVFNEATGFGELNGLRDIAPTEMENILRWGDYWTQVSTAMAYHYNYVGEQIIPNIRTSLPTVFGAGYADDYPEFPTFTWCSPFKVIRFGVTFPGQANKPIFKAGSHYGFYNGVNLTEISDWLYLTKDNFIGAGTGVYCPKLETIYLWHLEWNVDLKGLPALSRASIQFAIDNANNSAKAITITLHPTAYARVDAELAAAAAAKNITLIQYTQ